MSLIDKILVWFFLGALATSLGVVLIWQFWTAFDRWAYRRRWYAGQKRAAARDAELGPDANKSIIRQELR